MTKIDNDYGKLWITDKKTMRSLTLAISGQNNLNSSLSHRDPRENPNCQLCNEKQNSEHVLINCPDLEYLRYKLDYQNIQQNIYEKDQKLDLGKLTALIKKSGLFWLILPTQNRPPPKAVNYPKCWAAQTNKIVYGWYKTSSKTSIQRLPTLGWQAMEYPLRESAASLDCILEALQTWADLGALSTNRCTEPLLCIRTLGYYP